MVISCYILAGDPQSREIFNEFLILKLFHVRFIAVARTHNFSLQLI